MSEALEKLQDIGAQKIYEKTHIPIEHVQAILHKSYDGFSKVQFLGFLSILEREYGIDLSELRKNGVEKFASMRSLEEPESLFVMPKKRKKFTLLYILLAVAVFALGVYNTLGNTEESKTIQSVDNTLIDDVQKTLDLVEVNATDFNESNLSSQELNATQSSETELVVEPVLPESLKFYTRTKIWLGYIDIKTNKHYNKIFTGEFSIDPSKDWLLLFGHGYVDILLNDKVLSFEGKENVRFAYEGGEVRAISEHEFKQLNKGRKW